MSLHNLSLKSAVISLPERSDRRMAIRTQMELHGYDRYVFWDAKRGSPAALKNSKLTVGELGLWATTNELLAASVASDEKDALHVCEDDCLFSPEFFLALPNLIHQMEEHSLDVLFTDCYAGLNFMHLFLPVKVEEKIQILPGSKYYTGRTTSYIISRKAKKKLSDLIALEVGRSSGPEVAIDIYFKLLAHNELNVGVCFPFLTTINPNPQISKSDISGQGTPTSPAVRWEALHTITSQIFFIRSSELELGKNYGDVLSALTPQQLSVHYINTINCLIEMGYIEKARKGSS